jgi:hypothetical protein
MYLGASVIGPRPLDFSSTASSLDFSSRASAPRLAAKAATGGAAFDVDDDDEEEDEEEDDDGDDDDEEEEEDDDEGFDDCDGVGLDGVVDFVSNPGAGLRAAAAAGAGAGVGAGTGVAAGGVGVTTGALLGAAGGFLLQEGGFFDILVQEKKEAEWPAMCKSVDVVIYWETFEMRDEFCTQVLWHFTKLFHGKNVWASKLFT